MKAVAKEERRVAYSLALLFAILAGGIVTAGYYYYRNYEQHFRDVAEQQLFSVAKLKVDELAQYRKERLWNADAFFKNTAFSGLVRRFFDHPEDTDAQQQLQQWADKYLVTDQYDLVCLFDAQGVSRLSVPAGRPPISADVSQRVPEVLRSGQVTWHDFHRNEHDQRIYLTLLVPILDETGAGQALGVLALRIDPEIYLYPFIKRWPAPSQTAETLLVRRDGNDALFLNELKFQTNTALNLRISLAITYVPAVKAILGETGIVEGVDYRGEPVLASLHAIPDSPWFLVAREDTAEVYAPLRQRLRLTLLLVSLLLMCAGLGISAIWRQQRIRFYKERYEMAETLRESEERFGRVFEEGPTGMAMLDETFHFIQVNPTFASMLGYSAAELRTKTFTDVTHPDHIQRDVEQVRRLLRGELSVYQTEKRYIARSGKVLWGQVQVSVLRDAAGAFRYFLAIIGDITERKLAEEELRRVNRALRTVSECNQAMVRAPDEVTLLTDICRLLVEQGGYRMAWVGFAEHDETRSVHPVAQAGFDEGYLDIVNVTWADTERGRGPVGTAIRTRQPVIIRNVLTDPRFEPWRQAATQRSYAAVAALPLMRDDRVYGALTVYAAQPDVFDAGEMELLAELAGDVAYGITSLRARAERKRAEESLQNSQALYRSLVEHLPQSIFRKDRAGRFQFVNERFCRDLRRSFEDIVGRTDADFFPPELAQAYRRDDLRVMETGEGLDQEEKHVGADGQESFVHILKTPLRDTHGQIIGIQGVFWDITARKHAEEMLLYEQTLMATLMENVPDAIYFKDAASRFLRANRAQARKLGVSDPAQVIGKSDADYFSRERARQSLADEREIVRTGRPLLNVEEKETWLDGTVDWVLTTKLPLRDAAGRIIGTCGISRDITERKRAEEALRESRALYLSLAEQLSVGVFRKDRPGRFVLVNPEFCRLKGMKAEDFLGKTPREVADDAAARQGATGPATKYAATGMELHEQIMQTGKSVETIEEYQKADGRKQFLRVVRSPVMGPDGKIIGTQGVQFDITEHRQAEETIAHERQLLRTLIDLLPETFYIKDLNGRFLVANEALAKQWGKASPAELLGLSDADLFPAELAARYRAEELKVFAGEPVVARESICVYADGRDHTVMTTKVPYRDPQGRICGLVGFGYDITERKRAEEEVARTAKEWQATFDATKDAIWILDPNHRVLRSNKTAEGYFKRTCCEMIGKPCWEIVHGTSEPIPECPFVRARQSGHRETMELQQDERWFEVIVDPILDDAGQYAGAVHIVSDITERKQAEQALKESELRYHRISEAITDYIYNVRMADGRPVKTTHGPGCLAVTGYEAKEFVNDSFLWLRMVVAEDRPRVEAQARQILAGQDPPPIEHRIVHKNGTERWVRNTFVPHRDKRGVLVTYDGLIQDITERKRAEEALRESEVRYRTLFDKSADGILIADVETRKFKYANPVACRMLGYAEEELRTLGVPDIHPKEALPHIAAEFEAQVRGDKTLAADIPCLRKDGSVVHADINAVTMTVDGRSCNVGFFRDITERKRAEQALRESEVRFRTLIEKSPLAISISRGGKSIYVNQKFLDLYGFQSVDELVGQPIAIHWAPEFREMIMERAQRRSRGKPVPSEYEGMGQRKDGSQFPVHISVSLVELSDGAASMAFLTDITERKRAEEALRDSEEKFRSLFDNAAVGMFRTRLDGAEFLDVNDKYLSILGGTCEEVVGKPSVILWADPKEREEMVKILKAKGRVNDFECRLLNKAGTKINCLTSLRLYPETGILEGSIIDITERKRAEEALLASEAELLAILESTGDGILAVDRNGERVIKANRRYAEMWRIPQSIIDAGDNNAMRNSVLNQLSDPDAFLKRVHELYSTDKVAADTLVFKDGRVFERHGFPMMLAGAVLGRVWSFRDITERKRQEKELSEKSLELERFTYTVSHDLKSPLVTVKTFLGYLEQDLLNPDAERVRQDVGYMRTAADKMGHLLDELLKLARVGRKMNPPVRVTFQELAREAVGLVAGRISTSQAEVQVADASVVLEGDRPRLVEIWQNLVENACKFMGDQPKPRVEIGVEQRGAETVFFVRDNGIGIEPRYHEKVFSLFEKLNPKIEGTGMGLALVKRVVELYKGRIWVESGGSGQGANFLFTLPATVKIETETEQSS